jgi:NAD-dependent dihydropyrimidine dehydrogenase PreA subunit
MPHVISNKCIGEVYAACQQVCPAGAMHYVARLPPTYPSTGAPMMVIHQDDCIDCGACKPECPIDAIWAGGDDVRQTPDGQYWEAINKNLAPPFAGQMANPRGKTEPPRLPHNRLR